MNNPDLILADEPTASLDSKRAREVVEMMKREVKESQKQLLWLHMMKECLMYVIVYWRLEMDN